MTGTSTGPWDAGRIRRELAADLHFDWAIERAGRPPQRGAPYLTMHHEPVDVHGIPIVVAPLVPTEESTRANAVAAASTALGQACWPPGPYTLALRDSRGTVLLVDRFEHR